jgi:hypothetical protein
VCAGEYPFDLSGLHSLRKIVYELLKSLFAVEYGVKPSSPAGTRRVTEGNLARCQVGLGSARIAGKPFPSYICREGGRQNENRAFVICRYQKNT